MDEEEEAEASPPPRPRRTLRRATVMPMLVTVGIGALALGGVWIARAPLAENLIGRELAQRNVQMRYRIASIGPRTQRIENIVLGDPRNPDLIARWVEVDIALSGFIPGVAAVRAGGVRLKGSLRGGRMAFGELDKFLGQGGSTETILPDMDVQLVDARASILTDYGPLGLVLGGNGNMRDGFDGRGVAAMPAARMAGCAAERLVADLRIRMKDGAPRFTGPVTARALGCPADGIALAAPRLDVDARLDSRLACVDGSARLNAGALRAAGMTLAALDGTVSLRGNGDSFRGEGRIGGKAISGEGMAAGPSALTARVTGERVKGQGMRVALTGDLSLRNLAARRRDPLAGLAGSTAGTPLAPLVARLAKAVRDAGGNNSLTTRLAVRAAGNRGEAALSDLHFAAASGARIDLPEGSRAALGWPDRRWGLTGQLAMAGGGLPQGSLALAQGGGGGLSGTLALQPYAAGSARLALTPVRFRVGGDGGAQFATHMTLDGPLADGGVRGVSIPLIGALASDGRLSLNPACVPLRWQSVRLSTLTLNPAALTLCPDGGAMVRWGGGGVTGGIKARSIALSGRLGSNPLAVRADMLALGLARSTFRATGVEARIGGEEAPVLLGAGDLNGRFDKSGLTGDFAAGHGRIGTVPLDLTDMAGRWRFAGGRLEVDGGLRVSDTAAQARFHPVLVPDARLALVDGRITASGHVRHPTRGAPFARVDIAHGLSSGMGEARFALEGLRFGDALQPDDLTPSALGVVANVAGEVTGAGRIDWTGSKVTSAGRFATDNMNLAAAFGPVEGLSTTVDFTDLLAMETAPGQVATIRSINPGVLVTDGRVRYQLLAGNRARVEGGEWPFAGGRLALLPSTLDFDAKGARHLIFRVTGLDAGAFINTMELKNLSATGTYDGLLPMVFDASGGRIEGGILVARQEGLPPLVVESAQKLTVTCDPTRQAGTLSYVGDVSNAEMGAYGKMAFDALKKLRYKCLTILLDGAIDGEFLTRLAINGVNQGTDEARKSVITRSFLGLPFIFNVRIEAPFRGLLNTYQSFVDPSALIRGSLGPQYKTVLENRLAVQPADSEKGASREGE
ncbi:YdbH domain-containing protein [Sphingobium sufflavum]|uniref:intermembrane phospholipid transport protein YdbH family protein n=1 Tax=Sphingobium sufflavum TaxID=1129547 RepID=UPI001F24853F|nr:YdbH domain-containing protein [Sphingobium sufflavum]MCE7797021.1 YdbH domain-containing protein [Sphingobium sufflavum]